MTKEEYRAKMKLVMSNPEVRRKISEAMRRKGPVSEETKRKMSASQLGRKHSE